MQTADLPPDPALKVAEKEHVQTEIPGLVSPSVTDIQSIINLLHRTHTKKGKRSCKAAEISIFLS